MHPSILRGKAGETKRVFIAEHGGGGNGRTTSA